MKISQKYQGLRSLTTAATTLAIAASALIAPTAANAANSNDVVPDLALRACINANLNAWAIKWNKPEVGNRTKYATISQEMMEVYLPKTETLQCNTNNAAEGGTYNEGVKSLEGLQYAKGLKRISVRGSNSRAVNQRVSDMTPVLQLGQLEELDLGYNYITKLPNLSGLSSLKNLGLEGNGSQSGSAAFKGVTGISDITPVRSLKNLERLNVDYADVTSLSGVEGLTKMTTLLASHNKIRSLEPVRSLVNIVDLRVDTNYITDISPVAGMTKLRHFEFQNNNNASRLKDVGLTPSTMSVAAVAGKPLTRFDAANNSIADISVLANIPTLTGADAIDVRLNKIADLRPLARFSQIAIKNESPQYPDASAAPRYISGGVTHIDVSSLKNVAGNIVQVTRVASYVNGAWVNMPFTQKDGDVSLKTTYNGNLRVYYKAQGVTDTEESYVNPVAAKVFKDVSANYQFIKEISWLATSGITTGYADGTFHPGENINRDAMAAFFYRMAGSPAYTAPAVSPFSDVPTTHQFYKEISWLASSGITTGYADGTFRPNNAINRDAIAAFFYRYNGKPAFTLAKTSRFSDVPTTHQFYKEISWLASSGITTGYADGTFHPSDKINRDAVAAFIYRNQHR